MYWIGDNTDATQVYATVISVVSERPRTRAEIVELTGVSPNRINSALVKAQRDGIPLKNLGNQAKAVWYVPTMKRKYSPRTER